MADILKKIIEYLKNDKLFEAFDLCENNKDNKIEHLILNIKGVIFFKQQKFVQAKKEFLKSIELDKSFIDPYKNLFKLNLKTQDYDSAIKNGISANLAGGTHHAHYDYGSGYCIFNDIAIAANYCKNKYEEYQNILVLDLDVHQGDGSATMLKDVESVFTFSIHCGGNFPLKKQKSDLDVELEKGTGDEEYIEILQKNLNELKSIQFDIVFFQAGVDSLKFDSLGHLELTQDGMKKRNEIVLDFCAAQNLPLLIFMGGGYSNPIDHTVEAFHNLFVQCTKTIGTIKS